MKRISAAIIIFLITSSVLFAKDKLDKKLPIFAIVKPNKISTTIALGSGIVHRIHYKLGEKVGHGGLLLEVIEKEGIRQYKNTIDGRIGKLHVTLGAATSVGMPLITVVDPDDKLLEVSLSPEEAKLVSIGDNVYSPDTEKILATVERLSPLVDPERGAVTCYLMPKHQLNARIGEILSLEVLLPSKTLCDKVALISDLGKYTTGWQIEYISGDKACLKTK